MTWSLILVVSLLVGVLPFAQAQAMAGGISVAVKRSVIIETTVLLAASSAISQQRAPFGLEHNNPSIQVHPQDGPTGSMVSPAPAVDR